MVEVLRGVVPVNVQHFLERQRQGSVLLVTSKGIYLELVGGILVLCARQWGAVPIGITLERYEAVLSFTPKQGQSVSIRDGVLAFPGGSCLLELEHYEEANSFLQPKTDRLASMGRQLTALRKQTGLAPLWGESAEHWNPYCKAAYPAFAGLLAGLEAEDAAKAAAGAKGLLGLGPGLTPSGDDVLCGMLYGLLRSKKSGSEAVRALVETVKAEAPGRTNAISSAYLQAVAEGAPYTRMEEIWRTLAGEGNSSGSRLTEVGSNSGAEMLLGLLSAGRLLCRKEENSYG